MNREPNPADLPGFDRATGVDDVTPRAEYRDEPPSHAPPEPVTTYQITHVQSGNTGTTNDADRAERYARRPDYKVTAVTGGPLK